LISAHSPSKCSIAWRTDATPTVAPAIAASFPPDVPDLRVLDRCPHLDFGQPVGNQLPADGSQLGDLVADTSELSSVSRQSR
jgi:hypothetical protein